MRHISKQRECSYGSAKSCFYKKLFCCSWERKATTRLQIHGSVEKGPGLSSRLSLSSANGGVTLQIQTWFQEPFKLIKLCGTDQIYEYKAPKAVTVLTHQMWAQDTQDEAHLLCPSSA